ncbi:MAG: GGDEF domain-containing protein [Christensenella sp.]|nr:GGDEF domain-containing protein [Christensenella sp.]
MNLNGIRSFLVSFKSRHAPSKARRAVNLLVFQLIYVVLLLATMVLCVFVDRGERLAFYLFLLGGLLVIDAVALVLNLQGKFQSSTWLTSICMVFGPWLSILIDPTVINGDFVPLIYVAMSIQLCSILLTQRATLILATIQFTGLVVLILSSPALQAINWPSLVAFVVFTVIIGVLYGFANNRQLQQIEAQRNQLLLDEEKLRELSVRDSLTGLFNRRYMEETFEREIQRAQRKQLPLSVIMADIDGFKAINDKVGHVLGDNALVRVAAFLAKSIRASDVACRYGGDEFCLILPDCPPEEGIRRANALRTEVDKLRFDPNEAGIERLTMSFGVSSFPEDGLTREALLSAADSALYTAKRAGRNRVNGQTQHPTQP